MEDDSPRVAIIACTEADIEGPIPGPSQFARDGSCAHPQVDAMDRCRFCGIEMIEADHEHAAEAWWDDI